MLALILIIIAAVVVVAFWQAIFKIAIAALVIGIATLYITGLLDILHGLRALIP
jgi:hypothetical protein